MAGMFSNKVNKSKNWDDEIKDMLAKIGQPVVQNDICHKG